MKSKKLLILAISIVFSIVIIISVFMMFTVKEVDVKFSVYTDTNKTVELQEKFDKFTGKNLIFFDVNEIYEKVDVGSRFEITGVKKSFPNVIEVCVQERKERFSFTFGEDTFVLSDEGYVLDKTTNDSLIKINLVNITANEPVIGEKLSTDHDEDLFNAMALCSVDGVVDATAVDGIVDATKEITIEYIGRTMRSVIFLTKTDVKIRIPMATEYGKEKTETGFKAYFNEDRDYIKSYNEIRVDIQPDGTLKTVWIQQ